jgi:hypothetical protein
MARIQSCTAGRLIVARRFKAGKRNKTIQFPLGGSFGVKSIRTPVPQGRYNL